MRMKIKDKLSLQFIMSYIVLIISDMLMAFLYYMVYNHLLREVFYDLNEINFIQGYILFFIARLIFNRTQMTFSLEQEVFDSFKRNIQKFLHYSAWGILTKIIINLMF